MNTKILISVIGLSIFSTGCVAHHARVVPVKVVVPAKVVPTKVVVKTTPKVVVAKTSPANYVVVKTRPKTGVCTKQGAVWYCRK